MCRVPELPVEIWQLVMACADLEALKTIMRLSRALRASAAEAIRRRTYEAILAETSLLQGELCERLALHVDDVRRFNYVSQRRVGGGEYHVFSAQVVAEVAESYGGLTGFERRLHDAAARARQRDEALCSARSERRRRLGAGLAVLGLVERADSRMSDEYVSGAKRHELLLVLQTAARMRFLHEHTEYQRALDEAVLERSEDKGLHAGIHRFCAEEVQCERRFQLPDTLPWLPQFASTDAALSAALGAADPDEHARILNKQRLASERATARSARLQKLDAKIATAVACPSYDAWCAALRERHAPPPTTDDTIRAYLATTKTTKTSLRAMLAAIATFDEAYSEEKMAPVRARRAAEEEEARLAEAERRRVELEARAERTKRMAAQGKFTGDRVCTRPGCKNQHRMHSPMLGPLGPVCGACPLWARTPTVGERPDEVGDRTFTATEVAATLDPS